MHMNAVEKEGETVNEALQYAIDELEVDLEAVEFHDLPADAATGTGTLVFDPPRVSVPANTAKALPARDSAPASDLAVSSGQPTSLWHIVCSMALRAGVGMKCMKRRVEERREV